MANRNEAELLKMATQIDVTHPDGETMVYRQYQGFTFSDFLIKHRFPAKDLELQFKWISDMEIRDDDVIICAFPKTGTHWTWEIVNMIQTGSADYQKNTKVTNMLEYQTPEMMSSLTSPRVLNTHLTDNLLPRETKEKRCKIIHVMRNPKDIAVSMHFHRSTVFKSLTMDFSIQTFRGAFGNYSPCSYLWYVKQWEKFQTEYPSYPLLNLYYEDLKKNPFEETRRIAEFLGKGLSDDVLGEICTKCQFDKLKEAQTLKENAQSFIYRKGIVGDWKNHFSVKQNEDFDEWIQSEMKESNITFQYE